jgi:hypothetical protein
MNVDLITSKGFSLLDKVYNFHTKQEMTHPAAIDRDVRHGIRKLARKQPTHTQGRLLFGGLGEAILEDKFKTACDSVYFCPPQTAVDD